MTAGQGETNTVTVSRKYTPRSPRSPAPDNTGRWATPTRRSPSPRDERGDDLREAGDQSGSSQRMPDAAQIEAHGGAGNDNLTGSDDLFNWISTSQGDDTLTDARATTSWSLRARVRRAACRGRTNVQRGAATPRSAAIAARQPQPGGQGGATGPATSSVRPRWARTMNLVLNRMVIDSYQRRRCQVSTPSTRYLAPKSPVRTSRSKTPRRRPPGDHQCPTRRGPRCSGLPVGPR